MPHQQASGIMWHQEQAWQAGPWLVLPNAWLGKHTRHSKFHCASLLFNFLDPEMVNIRIWDIFFACCKATPLMLPARAETHRIGRTPQIWVCHSGPRTSNTPSPRYVPIINDPPPLYRLLTLSVPKSPNFLVFPGSHLLLITIRITIRITCRVTRNCDAICVFLFVKYQSQTTPTISSCFFLSFVNRNKKEQKTGFHKNHPTLFPLIFKMVFPKHKRSPFVVSLLFFSLQTLTDVCAFWSIRDIEIPANVH